MSQKQVRQKGQLVERIIQQHQQWHNKAVSVKLRSWPLAPRVIAIKIQYPQLNKPGYYYLS